MRILHLYSGNLYGGIERLLITLALERCWVPAMIPAFGLCFRGRLADELHQAGVPVIDFGPVRFSRPWTLVRARWRLARLLRRERFDVVMTHAAWPHAVFAKASRRANVRLVHMVHDVMTGPSNRFENRAGRTPPDIVIANSQFTARNVPLVFPRVRTEVVYLPVAPPAIRDDAADRAAIRTELRTPQSDVVILLAARLERLKGHAVLIEALGRLRNQPGWTAWIAGGPQKVQESDYLADLIASANKHGVQDRVRFLGQRSDVPRLLNSADIVCQPNTGPESFGIALVEALYAGKPVVTSAIGGPCEIVDDSCGVIIPSADVPRLEQALSRLICDPTHRHSLSINGPSRADRLCRPDRQMTRMFHFLRGKHDSAISNCSPNEFTADVAVKRETVL